MSEEQLQYGFRKKPKDSPNSRPIPNVPEEKLFAVDRTIVELNAPKHHHRHEEEDHEDEEEHEEEEEEHSDAFPGHLHYSDIGYLPAKNSDGKFIVQKSASKIAEEDEEDEQPVSECCGFRHGKIVKKESEEEESCADEGSHW